MTNDNNSTQAGLDEQREALRLERIELDRQRQELEAIRNQSPNATFVQFKNEVTQQVNMLRETIQQQKNEIQVLRQNNVENRNQLQNVNLLENFQLMNLDVKMPEFNSNLCNPNKFLGDLNKFFAVKKIPENHKLVIVSNALDEKARRWFDSKILINYQQFVTAFKEEFYSIPVQVEIKREWAERKHSQSGLSLQAYFLKQVNEASHFTPKMTNYETNYIIVKQLPFYVQQALIAIDFNDENAIGQALNRMDLIANEKEKVAKKSRNVYSENNSNNYKSQKLDNAKPNYSNQNKNYYNQNRPKPYLKPNNSNFNSHNVNSISQQNSGVDLPDFSIPPPNITQPNSQNSSDLN